MTHIHPEAGWSLISDKPLFVYDTMNDVHYCYWSGVQLTRTYATLIIMKHFLNIQIGQSMYAVAHKEYEQLAARKLVNPIVAAGSENAYYNIQSLIAKSLYELLKNYTPQQAVGWLLQEYEVKANNDT